MRETTGSVSIPPVRIMLGEMASYAAIVENMVYAQESQADWDDEGGLCPSRAALYAMMALQAEIHPKLLNMARELAGGSMIMLPSSVRDFENPEIAADLERYI